MASYVTNSACHGNKPRHLKGMIHHQRTELLAKMMRDRGVVRFLVAPPRYGKTALVLEYAEAIFGFHNVFWLNAQSPCFLRDLDEGILAPALVAQADKSSLVVFEDIPRLSEERLAALSSCVDALLEEGWEVVVSAIPCCDALLDHQPDGIVIRSQEFLVGDDELARLEDEAGTGSVDREARTAADRIPGIIWGDKDAPRMLLHAVADEVLPADVLLGMFAALVLGSGGLDDIAAITGPTKSDTLAMLERDFLFLGIDARRERFETHPFSIDDVIEEFGRMIPRMVQASTLPDQDMLALRLADMLVREEEHERACAVVIGCCSADVRGTWLEDRSRELADAGCILPAHRLFKSRSVRFGAATALLFAQEAWRLLLLGDHPAAHTMARRVYGCAQAPDRARATAALLVVRHGRGVERKVAYSMLQGITQTGADDAGLISVEVMALASKDRTWFLVSKAALWIAGDEKNLLPVAEALAATGVVSDAVSISLAWVLEALCRSTTYAIPAERSDEASRIAAIAADYLRRCEAYDRRSLCDATLLEAWDRMRECGLAEVPELSLPSLRTAAQTLQMACFAQSSEFERDRRTAKARRQDRSYGTALSREVPDAVHDSVIPELHIRLLGGLEVTIGGDEVDPSLFARQKVKSMLAVFALNQGKELLRDRVAAMLWPDSTPATAQRNFYSTWSLLRKALSRPGIGCPYLVRSQHSCKLDSRAVSSDVAEFDLLCDRLLLERSEKETWAALCGRLCELYRGDLLPSEGKVDYILRMRGEYRSRLIDALVSASTSLFEGGELQAALWYAHAAVRRDATREDAYAALMQAQVASGQRTAALDTFFKCKRYLERELGIDPSRKVQSLYGAIIEEEPGLRAFQPQAR